MNIYRVPWLYHGIPGIADSPAQPPASYLGRGQDRKESLWRQHLAQDTLSRLEQQFQEGKMYVEHPMAAMISSSHSQVPHAPLLGVTGNFFPWWTPQLPTGEGLCSLMNRIHLLKVSLCSLSASPASEF